jgi:hypothetical protein
MEGRRGLVLQRGAPGPEGIKIAGTGTTGLRPGGGSIPPGAPTPIPIDETAGFQDPISRTYASPLHRGTYESVTFALNTTSNNTW